MASKKYSNKKTNEALKSFSCFSFVFHFAHIFRSPARIPLLVPRVPLQESLTDQHKLAYNSLVEKPSTGAAFKQQLTEMEKSWRSATGSGRNPSLHTLPKSFSTTIPQSGHSRDCVPTSKPPNLHIAESFQNGGNSHGLSKENLMLDETAVCESPSYLTSNTSYHYGAEVTGLPLSTSTPANPVPLPPRDRFKPTTLPNQKRHVRKHALIIPATGTLRTLDRVGANHLSEENRMRLKTVADKSKMDLNADSNLNLNSDSKINFSALSKLQVVESAPQSPSCHQIYQNFSMMTASGHSDTASLDFETIVERKDLNHVPDLFAENGTGGGGECDQVDGETVGGGGGCETAALNGENNKEKGATTGLSNSVSCEDLLEFSEKKPNGRERGVESDEVRIMIKVLGPKMNPVMCLEALDILQWSDVHKAIKIIKLHNLMGNDRTGSLRECLELLENNDWNLQETAINM